MRKKYSLKSFQTKITLALIISMLFIGGMCNFLIYKFTLTTQFESLRSKLMVIAQTAALFIEPEELMRIPLTPDGKDTPQFKAIYDKLAKIKNANPSIRYIYTMTRTDEPGIWKFIVDLDSPGGPKAAHPGFKYEAGRFSEMLKAFDGPAADKKLEIDEWGVTLSGYAPVRNQDGKAVAILGVDLMADDVHRIQKKVHGRAVFVLILGIVFSLGVGTLVAGRINDPIKRLVEGTRYISEGNLNYRVQISGDDEISGLAEAFNTMAQNLNASRKKLLDYFYNVVKSLVRILEAKDHYTRGHSERVADYAEKIALQMNLSVDKIGLLREAALLHDIGKLGIREGILNKKEKLTEDEWEIIRKHPLVGEDILKPVILTEEMLAVIRGHHERYDGAGYPDHLKGESISIFASIITVADAYDAMTSPRAYRAQMSKEKAIEELRKNKGTQFNPNVVEAFLKILEQPSSSV